MKLLIRLFPRAWRERYRQEIDDHLAHSTRPARDRFDLLMALAPVWADGTRRLPSSRARRYTRTAAALLVTMGALSTVLSIRALENGVAEVTQHWWSSAALFPLATAALVFGFGELAARRTSPR